jgi:hypothetical protein
VRGELHAMMIERDRLKAGVGANPGCSACPGRTVQGSKPLGGLIVYRRKWNKARGGGEYVICD